MKKVVENFHGYRAWHLCDDVLSSPSFRDNEIQPGVNVAECANNHAYRDALLRNAVEQYKMHYLGVEGPLPLPNEDRRAPVWDCTCGYYAYYQPWDGHQLACDIPFMVASVVRASGRTIPHTHGFRTEKLEVLALSPIRTHEDDCDCHRCERDPDYDAAMRGLMLGGIARAGSRYGVPTFDTYTKMVEEFPPTHDNIEPKKNPFHKGVI